VASPILSWGMKGYKGWFQISLFTSTVLDWHILLICERVSHQFVKNSSWISSHSNVVLEWFNSYVQSLSSGGLSHPISSLGKACKWSYIRDTGSWLKSSPLKKNLTKMWEACSLSSDGIGDWEPPIGEFSYSSREVCDLPNIIIMHGRLHRLISDPLFFSAVLD
jgi:hypothetical protein